MTERVVNFKLTLPESLRSKFKAWCALQGMTMNDGLIQLVKKQVEQEQPEKEVS